MPALLPFILGRREFLVKIRQKFDHFLRGHISAPGSKFEKKKKMGRGFFVVNPQKIFGDILTRVTPSKPRVQVPTPQNFLKHSNFLGGAPVGGSLVGFGSKIAPVGTPKGKVNLASLTPK